MKGGTVIRLESIRVSVAKASAVIKFLLRVYEYSVQSFR